MAGHGFITFVLGGARSGKSSFALAGASALPGRKVYVATAQALDEEMKERVRKHREERTKEWATLEEPLTVPAALEDMHTRCEVVLIDCLTLWLSNVLLSGVEDSKNSIDALISALGGCKVPHMYLVSNEVGLGIVPENALARRFRDAAGLLNQRVAAIADAVYFVAAGIPLKMK